MYDCNAVESVEEASCLISLENVSECRSRLTSILCKTEKYDPEVNNINSSGQNEVNINNHAYLKVASDNSHCVYNKGDFGGLEPADLVASGTTLEDSHRTKLRDVIDSVIFDAYKPSLENVTECKPQLTSILCKTVKYEVVADSSHCLYSAGYSETDFDFLGKRNMYQPVVRLQKLYECTDCGELFVNIKLFGEHVNAHEDTTENTCNYGTETTICPIESRQFSASLGSAGLANSGTSIKINQSSETTLKDSHRTKLTDIIDNVVCDAYKPSLGNVTECRFQLASVLCKTEKYDPEINSINSSGQNEVTRNNKPCMKVIPDSSHCVYNAGYSETDFDFLEKRNMYQPVVRLQKLYECTDCGELFVNIKLFGEHVNSHEDTTENTCNYVTETTICPIESKQFSASLGSAGLATSGTSIKINQSSETTLEDSHRAKLTDIIDNVVCDVYKPSLLKLDKCGKDLNNVCQHFEADEKTQLKTLENASECSTRRKIKQEPGLEQKTLENAAECSIKTNIKQETELVQDCSLEQTGDGMNQPLKIQQNSKSMIRFKKRSKTNLHRCSKCGHYFKDEKLFSEHLKLHGEKRGYQCEICGKVIKRRHHFMEHMYIHRGIKLFKCDICEKKFSSSSSFRTHMKYHTGNKPHECTTCGKCFIYNSSLEIHMRRHTGERPYECKVCEKKFTENSAYRRHLHIHAGYKPHECKKCGKRFCKPSKLKMHETTHSNERPCQCEICGSKFKHMQALRKHALIHVAEKPFVCSKCGKRFAQKGNLNVHKRTHTGDKPYECETCGKKFARFDNLKTHIMTHTGDKPHECHSCGMRFCRSDNLKSHIRRTH